LVKRVAEPDWQGDIIMGIISGSLYFADIELSEAVDCTLDYLTLLGLLPEVSGVYGVSEGSIGFRQTF